jgi:hypothetical protein
MSEKQKNTDTLNIDMSINFFEDLVVLLKELKLRRDKDEIQQDEIQQEKIKKVKI